MHYVYQLVNPILCAPFYVGITNRPSIRFTQHMNPDSAPRAIVTKYINNMRGYGVDPEMEIMYEYENRKQAEEKETELIHEYFKKYVILNDLKTPQKYRDKSWMQLITVIADDGLNACNQKEFVSDWYNSLEGDITKQVLWEIADTLNCDNESRKVYDSCRFIYQNLDRFMSTLYFDVYTANLCTVVYPHYMDVIDASNTWGNSVAKLLAKK